ncbi:hypothetical protein FHE66_02750 [Georgenia sp. 311]|uniref:hypothetical protein n=1 Tax=Georgenia sp. 311 TaxID=2585134 RepID=UPI001111D3D3|nr:hypothetical protein [Georgenia sp. 311]TNC19781.1 hypothetical protein FHE66_02750 [Georgenia sp. 311]
MTENIERSSPPRRDTRIASVVWATIFVALSLGMIWALYGSSLSKLTFAGFTPMACAVMYARKTFEAADGERSLYRSRREHAEQAARQSSLWIAGATISTLFIGWFAGVAAMEKLVF